MQSYIPDCNIACEGCDKFFVYYTNIYSIVDADAKNELAKAAYSGIINRITCPYCNTEFTYEGPLFIHSYINKFAVTAQFPDYYTNITSIDTAGRISGFDTWKLRNCSFAMDASEKVRIFTCGLNDGTIEIVKLKTFANYSQMNLLDEYISFEALKGDILIFSHRDYTDKIIRMHEVSKSIYDKEAVICIPNGRWMKIDRNWAMEYI